jgi:hypothetical protein
MDRKASVDEVAVFRARAGGVKRRMLDQPDTFGRVSARDRLGARFHLRESVGILGQSRGDDPFDWGRVIGRQERRVRREARIEHAAFYQIASFRASRAGTPRPSASRPRTSLCASIISVA